MNSINTWIEELWCLPAPLEAACLILVLLLLLRWLQRKQLGTPLDGKKCIFLVALTGMVAILASTWPPNPAWYTLLFALFLAVITVAEKWPKTPEKVDGLDSALRMQQYEEEQKKLRQQILDLQASGAMVDDKQLLLLEAQLQAVQEHLSDVRKSWEEELERRKNADAALDELEGQLPESRITAAKKSLDQGDTETAEKAFDEVLDKGSGPIALAAYQSGQLAEGRLDYKKAMRQYKKAVVLEEDNPDYLLAAGEMALTIADYNRAREWLEQLLAIREREKKEDTAFALVLDRLATLHQYQGDYKEAEPLFQRALAIRKKALGREHQDVAESLNNIALLYKTQGRDAEAEPLYKRALEIREKFLGKGHPDVAQSLNNLAGLYQAQGRYEEAEPLYRHSLEITKKALGKDHPSMATALTNLAGLYQTQGRIEEAEPLHRQSLAIFEQTLGENHPHVATSLAYLAELYKAQGRYADAERLCKRVLDMIEESLGQEHPYVASPLNNLAVLYDALGRYEEAESLYKRCLYILRAAFPNGHPNIDTGQANYDKLQRKMAEQ